MKTFIPKKAAALEGKRYIGIDLAKKESQLAVLDERGAIVAQKRFQIALAFSHLSPGFPIIKRY